MTKAGLPSVTFRYFDEGNTRVDWSNGASAVVDNETARRAIDVHRQHGWTLGAAT